MKNFNKKIYVAGHMGMVGSAIISQLNQEGFDNIIFRTKKELDLTNQSLVHNFLRFERPDFIFIAAAKVGGIFANNNYPAEFIYQNLMIESNLIHGSYLAGIKNLLFLGSSCIYPKESKQPIKEEYLLSGELEPTNEPYAISKIAGIKLCESYNRQYGTNYRSVMPTNLYGPNDNFDLNSSHVIPALIRKFHEAKINDIPSVEVWGSGSQLRDFLYVKDVALASTFIMNLEENNLSEAVTSMTSHINVGSGEEISIKEASILIKDIVGYHGNIVFNASMPDGAARKFLDNSKIEKLGWSPTISFKDGLKTTYNWFLHNQNLLKDK
ncbi:GDP-L-fucose synthase [Candidatus Thioglobus sp.]|nr:GDP-L-fucose synthase [Candidatus Thioglobus sp.]